MNRAFYGIRALNAPDGLPTNAIYGFLSTMKMLLDEINPQYLCVCFDVHAPTFRHDQFDAYKAQRKTMPEDLQKQMPIIKETLDAMGIARCEMAGFEADDLIGTITKKCEQQGIFCDIITGDKDSFQLVTEKTHVKHIKTRAGKTERIEYDIARFTEEYGFEPIKIIDLKALMGDASDNIPGVAGIGEKTALDLVTRFGSIKNIYDNLESLDIKDSVRSKLEAGREMAAKSYELATIVTDAPIDFCLENAAFSGFAPETHKQFVRLGLNRFIEKWNIAESDGADTVISINKSQQMESIQGASAHQILGAIESAEYIAVLAAENLDSLEICDGKTVYAVSWGNFDGDYNALLKTIFSPDIKKVSHNVKDLMGLLLEEGISLDGFIFDTALAAYLLDSTQSDYNLSSLGEKYLDPSDGAHNDSGIAFSLYTVLDEKLKSLEMTSLMYDMELPLCEVLACCEREGFMADKQALYEYGKALSAAVIELQKRIWALAGEEFNINSPKQLGVILFEKLNLPHGKKTKTGWSTNVDVLEALCGKHDIIEEILNYRQISKLKSTYADGLLKVIGKDGRIHTKFQMTVTATGRLSSVEPNLQNIPVRSPLGAELRKMFIASPGKLLADADYSQIELRLLAHISNDETMINAFLSGEDIHTVTASQVFGVPPEDVTPLMRSRAKAVNFGIVYGISAFSLAQDIGVFQNEAKAYIDAYFEKYHGVREYMASVVERAKQDGYVQTLYGRRRYLPELNSSNRNIRSFGERVALNMPIQGAAADIMKLAMVKVYNRLKAEGLESKLILQVHDELLAEGPESEIEQVSKILSEEMQNVIKLKIPLTAETKIGKSWAQAH